ncbi:O-antigen ligase family protein [Roseomonas sp. KE2513]|uniref:O-antigen ligase family protein n=1 Tax=Roseomonas sp. KE2513 TaxID=2479202 RepID=UPI0018DFEF91|nr:O-antigen ligase family protein [Roseomonas sp. KE2513]MBI0539069.1 O-antigen ligase family protein [Roseomonas sp. KE2513]
MAVPIVRGRPALPASPSASPTGTGRFQAVLIGVLFAFYAGARIRLAPPDDTAAAGSDPLNTAVTLVALLLGGWLVLRHLRVVPRLLLGAAPLLLMLLAMFASAAWSVAPENSIRRSVTMTSLMLFAVGAQAALGDQRLMRIALRAMLAAAALSVMEAVLRPAYGFDTGEYADAIRGLYGQKNSFGISLFSGVLALSFGALARGRLSAADYAVSGALLLCLVLSRSTTSLLLSIAVCGITPLVIALDSPGASRILAIIGLLLGVTAAGLLLLTVNTSDLLDLIGKDASLTGRTEIWEAIDEAIARRPLLGYGYSAFWIDGSNRVLRVWDHVAWEVISAHSGYREFLLHFGQMGMLLLAAVVGLTFCLILRAIWYGRWRLGAWMLMFLGTLAVLNNSESVLFDVGLMTIYWMVGALSLAAVRPGRSGTPIHRG